MALFRTELVAPHRRLAKVALLFLEGRRLHRHGIVARLQGIAWDETPAFVVVVTELRERDEFY